MQPYKAVLFDLDGTLLNTLDDLTDSVNTILQQHGFPLRDAPEIRSFLGNGADALLHASLPEDTDEETFALCLVEYKAYYQQHMEDKTRPYEGIWELLDSLRAAGIKTAVASNKFYTAVQGLCEKYFSGKVNVAVGECQTETLHIRRKPSPDMLFMAAEQLGVPHHLLCLFPPEQKQQGYSNDSFAAVITTDQFRQKYGCQEYGRPACPFNQQLLTVSADFLHGPYHQKA